MDDIQGIWESYSLYVELESEFKDYTKNKYYKIVNGKNTIDITIHDQQKDSSEVSLGYIGFLDALESEMSLSENELIKSLNDSGKLLVRFKKDLKTYGRKNIQTSLDFERYFDVEEILEDGFDYESETEKFSFKSLSTLPEFLFKLLKEKSKQDNLDYIKEGDLENYSLRAKAISSKVYFHTAQTERSQRKAFLVKGDIAYVEEVGEDWAKIYYDGKTVTGGYVKISEIKILKNDN